MVQIFQELRRGQTLDGKQKLKAPSGVAVDRRGNRLSAAAWRWPGHFGTGKVEDRDLAAGPARRRS